MRVKGLEGVEVSVRGHIRSPSEERRTQELPVGTMTG